ncbi:hypothetical protein HN954_03195 [bacterium]|jgi:mRNA-degrading endonuclease RelE of RelBE toxin-antitoxin system|nr:hypothetical protein [bacterium]MBT6832143.1 hypothetical protein [bacterium]MBT6996411.1 hypothetical protein [bacterium]MBT7772146.1 hypothetical protein [bacterium]
MIVFEFLSSSEKSFQKIDKKNQDRIIKKLQSLKKHPNIFHILRPLFDFKPATHRLRIGNFRLILKQEAATNFLILDIGDRREIYK